MMSSLRRLAAIVAKELRQLRRDRLTFAMIIGIPTLQLLLFGFAINTDVRQLAGAVVDQADTAASRALVQELAHAQVMDLRERLPSPAAIAESMRLGRISLAVVVPPDFERRLARGEGPLLQLIVDGSDPTVASAAAQLAAVPLPGGSAPRAELLRLYNPERRSAINTVPALIGVILTMTMTLFTAVAIVRERERGNLELLITTPLRPIELIVGKVLPFVLIGLVQVSVVLGLGVLIFAVPIRGSLLDVYLAALVYIVATLGLGVLLSTLARTQFQSMQLAFFTFLPQILLSGFMFPFAGMPRAAQWLAEVLPLTHFIRLIRGVMLRDARLVELWPEVAALLVFSVLMLGLAMLRFRKRLD